MPGPRTKNQEPRTRDARERTRGVPAARNRRSRTSAWRTTKICSTAIWITCEGCRRPRLRSGPGRDVSRCRWHPGRTRQWHRSTRTPSSATGESAEARSVEPAVDQRDRVVHAHEPRNGPRPVLKAYRPSYRARTAVSTATPARWMPTRRVPPVVLVADVLEHVRVRLVAHRQRQGQRLRQRSLDRRTR